MSNESPINHRFSFGPWNISEGADPFGSEIREAYPHEQKYALYKNLGFDGVQFHDDDVAPGIDDLTPERAPFRLVPRSHLSFHAEASLYVRYKSHPEEITLVVPLSSWR